jgi:hypothetical protein
MNLRQNLSHCSPNWRAFPGCPRPDLRERFREDRLGLSASSLPSPRDRAGALLHGGAGDLHRLPMFGKLQSNLQGWLVQSLVPDAIARRCSATSRSSPARPAGWVSSAWARW